MDIQTLLPGFLRSANLCRYEDGRILILDRRRLPFEQEYVECRTVEDVASALSAMVTQGGGPLETALRTMIMAADQGRDLDEAAALLASSRRTNRTMAHALEGLLESCRQGADIRKEVARILARYDSCYEKMSYYGSALISDGAGILTTCFAEHSFLLSVKRAVMEGKDVRVYVNETRPYLQGARLTAPALHEMGIRCTLVTDGMGAGLMKGGLVSLYMTACDLYMECGAVVNKVGTLANAVAAKRYGVPYYAFALEKSPDRELELEYRNGVEVLEFCGKRITGEGIDALYPAFDVMEKDLVSGVVTPRGVEK